MTPAQIDAVIAGLTRAQREAVVSWPELGRKRYPSPGLLDCVEQHWVCERWGGAEERWFLNLLGLAVRQRLVEMENDK